MRNMRKTFRPVAALIMVMLAIAAPHSLGDAEGPAELSDRQKHIIPVAAFTATGNIEELKIAFHEALDAGLTVNEIKEVLIQMYAYAGFPRSLNGINTFVSVLEARKAKGVQDPVGTQASPLPVDFDANGYGNKARNELTGVDLTNNPRGYAQFAPVIDVFLKEHLFGDIFARDVLDYQERELATLGALAAMDGTESQLNGHLKVSLNVGLTIEQLNEFVDVLKDKVSVEASKKARKLIDEIQTNRN